MIVLPGSAPATAAQRNAALQRTYLPLVIIPPAVEVVDAYAINGRDGLWRQVITLRNNTSKTVCHISFSYVLLDSSGGIGAVQTLVPVLFPAETVNFTSLLRPNEEIFFLDTSIGPFTSEACPYAQLTPILQEVSANGDHSVSVIGTIRNDTPTTLKDIEVMLSPGSSSMPSQVVQVTPTTLDPGGVATYSARMGFPDEPVLPTSFDVRAYGSSDSLGQ
jgi:hypothetical protein